MRELLAHYRDDGPLSEAFRRAGPLRLQSLAVTWVGAIGLAQAEVLLRAGVREQDLGWVRARDGDRQRHAFGDRVVQCRPAAGTHRAQRGARKYTGCCARARNGLKVLAQK